MTPEQLIRRQFDAYNAKDVEGWLATYAADAEQYELHGALLAKGHAAMRERIVQRFAEPDLHAELLHRIVMGDVVVDHERVTRNFPDGKAAVEMLCVYQIRDGLIRRASFAIKPR